MMCYCVYMSGSSRIHMKKFALISGLLFLIVYFWVSIVQSDENGADGSYSVSAASSDPVAASPNDSVIHDLTNTKYLNKLPASYYLIVGSFTDVIQAEQVAEKYTLIFDADILILPPTTKGYYRISCGKYAAGEEADAALASARQSRYPDAWLLAVNN